MNICSEKNRLICVTGGSGSGKSAIAEQMAAQLSDAGKVYLATMQCGDEESRKRVARHRAMRAEKNFVTIERPVDLAHLSLPPCEVVLLECLSNLAANEMFAPKGAGAQAEQAILQGIAHVRAQCRTLIVVTNEIFSDGVRYDAHTEHYLAVLGRLNRKLAQQAQQVIEVVCGIPIRWGRKENSDERAVGSV